MLQESSSLQQCQTQLAQLRSEFDRQTAAHASEMESINKQSQSKLNDANSRESVLQSRVNQLIAQANSSEQVCVSTCIHSETDEFACPFQTISELKSQLSLSRSSQAQQQSELNAQLLSATAARDEATSRAKQLESELKSNNERLSKQTVQLQQLETESAQVGDASVFRSVPSNNFFSMHTLKFASISTAIQRDAEATCSIGQRIESSRISNKQTLAC